MDLPDPKARRDAVLFFAPLVVVAIATLVASALSFYHIGALSFWGDEIDTMRFSSQSLGGMFPAIWPQEFNMVLYYIGVHFWALLFSSPSEGQLRAFSALFAIAEIPLVFLLGQELVRERAAGRWIGAVAACLLAVNAYQIQYAQELRSYSLMPLMATLSTWLLVRAVRDRGAKRWWAAYAMISIAGIYVHYFLLLLTGAQAVSLFVLLRSERPPIKEALIAYACVALGAVPAAIAALTAGVGYLNWISAPNIYTILQFGVSITGSEGAALLAAYCLALAVGLWFLIRYRDGDLAYVWTSVLLVGSIVLPLVLVIGESLVRTPLFNERYFLFDIPFLSLVAAAGIVGLIRMGAWIYASAGVACLFLLVVLSGFGLANYYAYYKKDDWRGAAEFLSANCSTPQDLRVYFPQWTAPYAAYYAPDTAAQDAALQHALIAPDLEQFAAALPGGYRQVCLVTSQEYSQAVTRQIQEIGSAVRARYPVPIASMHLHGIEMDIYGK